MSQSLSPSSKCPWRFYINRDVCHSFGGSLVEEKIKALKYWNSEDSNFYKLSKTCKFVSTSRSTTSERLKTWKIKLSLDSRRSKFKSTYNYNIIKTENQEVLSFNLYLRESIKWVNTKDCICYIHQYTKFNYMNYISPKSRGKIVLFYDIGLDYPYVEYFECWVYCFDIWGFFFVFQCCRCSLGLPIILVATLIVFDHNMSKLKLGSMALAIGAGFYCLCLSAICWWF